MTITITIAFDAVDGKRDELVEKMQGVIPDTLAFSGCENIVFAEQLEAPGRLILIEEWASAEHYAQYKAWRAESGTSVLGMGLVEGAPHTTMYAPLD